MLRSYLLLAAFLAVGLCYKTYAPPAREDCPPKGYKQLFVGKDLSNLPPGDYAICLTPDEAAAGRGNFGGGFTSATFDLKRGLWKMTDSKLVVDAGIAINVTFPARVDFTNVLIAPLRYTYNSGLNSFFGHNGLHLAGAYQHGSRKAKVEHGDCGSLKDLTVYGTHSDETALSFKNCSSKTYLKNIRSATGATFRVEDSVLAVYDLDASTDDDDVVIATHSNLGLVRPFLYTEGQHCVRSRRGSSVTVCDPLLESVNDEALMLGDDDDDERTSAQNFLALAGAFGNDLDDDVDFEGQSGLLVTLKSCPQVFSATYDPKLWTRQMSKPI